MAKQGQIKALAEMFRNLGEPTRLRLLMELQKGERNVTQLCKKLKAPQPTVSHHLGILRVGGLVANRRSGKEIFYSLSDLTRLATGRAMKAMLKRSAAIKIGPFVLGMKKS